MSAFVTLPAVAITEYCSEYVCVSVCLSARLSPLPHAQSLPNFFMHVALWLWLSPHPASLRYDMYFMTSCFLYNDVNFATNGRFGLNLRS